MPLKIKSTSGSVTLEAENVSGDTTLTVPSGTATLATKENFTSTGIDDNATSTAITIDSSESVGIGETTPARFLHVKDPSGGNIVAFFESTDANGSISIGDNSGSVNVQSIAGAMVMNVNGNTTNGGGLTEAMRIDSSGIVTIPNQPACTIACQAGDINWGTGSLVGYGTTGSSKIIDTHNSFNMAAHTYTVPAAGNYYVGYTCNDVSSTSGRMRAYLRVNGSNTGNNIHARGTSGITSDLDMRTIAIVLPLQANDTVNVYVGEGTVDTFGSNYFTIYMLG